MADLPPGFVIRGSATSDLPPGFTVRGQQQSPAPNPDSRFLADEPGYVYGSILPFKKDVATGEKSFAVPEMIRSPVRGVQDLQTMAQNESTDVTPDAVSAMLGMIGGRAPISAVGTEAKAAGTGLNALADAYAAKYPVGTGPMDPLEMKVATPIDQATVRAAGTNAYKAVDSSGTVLTPSVTDRALNVVEAAKQKPLFNGTVITKEQADINAALEDYLPAKGQPMTMRDLQGLDSTLGDKVAQAYVSGNANKARILGDVQDKIREIVKPENLAPSDATGTAEGVNTLFNDAIPLWSTQAKMADLQKIVDRANAMDNPSPAMRTGFRNLMLSDRFKTYPPEVQRLISKAAVTGNADDLLGIMGSRLNVIANGAVGGLPGAVLSLGMTKVARGVRNAMKNAQADRINNAMVNGVRPSIEKFSELPKPENPGPMLALPAPKILQDRYGVNYFESSAPPLPDEFGLRGPQSPFTPDPRDIEAARNKTSPIFDAMEAAKQQNINQAWQANQIPLEDLIAQAERNAQALAAAKGETYSTSSLGLALRGATRKRK